MDDGTKVSTEQLQVMTHAAGLNVPVEELEPLAVRYSEFLVGYAKLRQLDVGDRTPPMLNPLPERR
jgi:hypothetical protein